jgi:hypothetical protein
VLLLFQFVHKDTQSQSVAEDLLHQEMEIQDQIQLLFQ